MIKVKKILSISLALLPLMGWAKHVDEATAKNAGANFLIKKGVAGVNAAADLSTVYTAVSSPDKGSVTAYYVFNINNGNGFVMVSGDDAIIPILGYSYEFPFDMNHMSPSTRDWIDGYKNQITAAVTHNIPAKATTPGQWAELQTADRRSGKITKATAVSPLVTTLWDQSGGGSVPYNAYCPNTTSTAGLSVTGCVATALAQLVKFWNWPTVGCGYHSYYDAYTTSAGSGSNTWNPANYGNTAYAWSSMPLSSSNSAVATLMYHCGVSVNMSYSSNESGAYVTLPESYPVNCAEYALKTYFHYKSTTKSVLREGIGGNTLGSYYVGPDLVYCSGNVTIDSIAESAWVTMLQAELTAGRPMLYEGAGSLGGHCWICDGWETTGDMFHFNWGWSGASNGFFTVDALAPPALGVGGGGGNFNYDQGVVMGVVPDSFPSNPGSIALQAHLNCTTSSPAPYGTPYSITTKIFNTGSSSITADFAAQVFDTSSNLVATLSILPGVSIAAGDSSAALTFADSNASLLTIPVSYHSIRVMYRPSGTSTWTPVANNGKFINYTMYDVMNDTDIVLYDSLHVGSHNIVPGGSVSVSTTIANQNYYGTNFTGSLRAILLNVATGDTFVIQTLTSQAITDGSQITATFSNSAVTAANGVYALIVQHQYGGSGAFYVTSSDFFVNPILMTIGASSTGVPTQTFGGNVEVFPNPARETVNFLVTGTTASELHVMDIMGKQVAALRTSGGFASMALNSLAEGTYIAQIETATGVVTKKFVVVK